jgi:hypothetical protein
MCQVLLKHGRKTPSKSPASMRPRRKMVLMEPHEPSQATLEVQQTLEETHPAGPPGRDYRTGYKRLQEEPD